MANIQKATGKKAPCSTAVQKKSEKKEEEEDKSVFQGLGSLLASGEFYDFTLFVGPEKKEFKVYKGILTQNSGYFRNLLRSKNFLELETNEVYLKEHNVTEMTVVLYWIYEGKICFEKLQSENVEVLANIFVHASYFDVPSLKKVVIQRMCSALPAIADYILYKRNVKKSESITKPAVFDKAIKVILDHFHAEDKSVDAFLVALCQNGFLAYILKHAELSKTLLNEPKLMFRLLEIETGRKNPYKGYWEDEYVSYKDTNEDGLEEEPYPRKKPRVGC